MLFCKKILTIFYPTLSPIRGIGHWRGRKFKDGKGRGGEGRGGKRSRAPGPRGGKGIELTKFMLPTCHVGPPNILLVAPPRRILDVK
jgi:hypothetical protein